jgi:hypothetical protein
MKLPRFTLRDLFWLMLVVAMGCAWWLDRRGSKRENAQLRQQLELLKLNAFDFPQMSERAR